MAEVNLYRQTSEAEKYGTAVAFLAPNTIGLNAALYRRNRAVAFGIRLDQMGASGQLEPVAQANIGLAAKLAVTGTGLGALLLAAKRHREFIESEVKAGVDALGGFDKILPGSEWAFVLEDVVRDADGKITGYALPGIPFLYPVAASRPNQPPIVYSVDIEMQQDGSGKAVFTVVSGTPASGDPL